jgi:hypothetical protein
METAALVVVLPTPPFPEVTTIILATRALQIQKALFTGFR